MGLIHAMIQTRRGTFLSGEKLARLKRRRLKKLVDYARKNSPFYRDLYAHIGDDFRLADLPPVTKPQLMENFDLAVTDRNITMKAVEAFCADPDNVGRMLRGKYLVFRTSGSTGHPAVVLM